MCEAQVHIFDLALARPAKQLIVDFVEHSKPAGSNWMPERLQPAIRVYRQLSFQGKCASVDIMLSLAGFREAEIFIDDELGYREAIMNLCHAHLSPRVFDAALVIDLLGGGFCLGKAREIERLVQPDW